ncbi:Protocadherin alpha-11 [Takifugu flavidus]|uniref:Protocadherin alpha-11 n=1 Tax=Takifugu flavidus TaxID=433684 RepID=A0A5C6P5V6_9TELE|nr:Protocadherin alpha-11 [Takifugu flavidus]
MEGAGLHGGGGDPSVHRKGPPDCEGDRHRRRFRAERQGDVPTPADQRCEPFQPGPVQRRDPYDQDVQLQRPEAAAIGDCRQRQRQPRSLRHRDHQDIDGGTRHGLLRDHGAASRIRRLQRPEPVPGDRTGGRVLPVAHNHLGHHRAEVSETKTEGHQDPASQPEQCDQQEQRHQPEELHHRRLHPDLQRRLLVQSVPGRDAEGEGGRETAHNSQGSRLFCVQHTEEHRAERDHRLQSVHAGVLKMKGSPFYNWRSQGENCRDTVIPSHETLSSSCPQPPHTHPDEDATALARSLRSPSQKQDIDNESPQLSIVSSKHESA